MPKLELLADLREGWARTPRAEWVALAAIVLIAIAIRAAFVNGPIRYDEADTFVHYVDQPLKHSLRYNYVPNNHVFHTLLSRPFRLLLGGEVWSLRMVALLSGVLCVPAGYLAARAHYGHGAGLLAAALIASSSALIEFSTNARGYTLLALITLLQVALADHLVRRPNRLGWALFAILAALGFYTVPINLFALGIVGVWMVLAVAVAYERPAQWRFLGQLTLATLAGAGLTLLLYAPLIAASGFQRVLGHKRASPADWEVFAASSSEMLGKIGRHWNRDLTPVIPWLLVGGFVLAIVAHRRAARVRVPLLLAAAAWLGPSLILQRPEFNSPRIWLFLLPLYLLIAAGGLAWLAWWLARRWPAAPRWGAVACVAVAAGLSANVWRTQRVAASRDTGVSWNAREVVAHLQSRLREGDMVIAVNHDNWPISYYFRRRGLSHKHLAWEISSEEQRAARRLWVVVGERGQQTLEKNMAERGFGPEVAEKVVAEVKFPHAVVYEIPLE